MGFSRQDDWSGLPFPSPGDLPDPGIQPTSSVSLALKADPLPAEFSGKVSFSMRASLVTQLVKNPPAMWEVLSLGWEDPLEKGTATHSSILSWRVAWTV